MALRIAVLVVVFGVCSLAHAQAVPKAGKVARGAEAEAEEPDIEFSPEEEVLIEDYAIELAKLHVKRLEEAYAKIKKKDSVAGISAKKQLDAVKAYAAGLADRIHSKREIAAYQKKCATEKISGSEAIAKLDALDKACTEARKACREAKIAYGKATPNAMPNYVAMSQGKATESRLRRLKEK